MKQWKKMLLILMCAGAMSGLTGCGNNTNDTDDNVDDLDPDDTEKNDTGKNDTDNTR